MPKLSLWQKFRPHRLHRMIKRENEKRPGKGSVVLKGGELAPVTQIEGYIWTLIDGREVTAKDIADAGDPKWLYNIYC